MPQRIEITGGFSSDEDEADRLGGTVEQDASKRLRPPRRGKPDPFGDVELPKKRVPGKPNPFSDV